MARNICRADNWPCHSAGTRSGGEIREREKRGEEKNRGNDFPTVFQMAMSGRHCAALGVRATPGLEVDGAGHARAKNSFNVYSEKER